MNGMYVVPICFNFINWLRDNFLMPIIEFTAEIFVNIFIEFLDILINSLLEKIVVFIYGFYVAILKIIDMLQNIFDAISGANYVHYTQTVNGVTKSGEGYLTEILLRMPVIRDVFLKVWVLSVVLCFIFLIAAVLRSISNLNEEGQKINDIIKLAANTFVMFFMVQLIAFGTVSLSSVVLSGVEKSMNYALGSDSNIKMSNCIFAASAINAGKTGDPKKDAANVLGQLVGEVPYNPDWSKVEGFYNGERKYYDVEDVKKDLLLTKIDYISGLICVIFVLKYMAGSALVFVQRIILVVLGLIIAPFFVALTPLDGGERFNRWKEFFIGTCFSSLGVIISVKVYFILIPVFVSDNFIYQGTGILSYLIRLYSIVILSLAFEKTGDIFNRILSDAHIMSSGEAFGAIMNAFNSLRQTKNGTKSFMKSVSGKKTGGK